VWPVADGKTLPMGPCWPDGPAISANVPLMIGTIETEMTMLIGTVDPSTFALDDDGLRTRLAKLFAAEDIESVINTCHPAECDAEPALFCYRHRELVPARGLACAKAAQNAAPVYSTSSTGTLQSATESG
jgi:para-nitrobenzyl esterase